MKPDGVIMDTTEPTEVVAVVEPSSLEENLPSQDQPQPEETANTRHGAAPKSNGKPPTVDPKIKPKEVGSKTRSTASATVSGSNFRPGTTTHRTGNDVRPANAAPAGKRAATNATSKASVVGAVPKRPIGAAAASSTTKNQTRVPDKRPVGPSRTATAPVATVTNSTKPSAVNGTFKKRPAAETDNGAKARTTAVANRTVASTASKLSSSKTTKPPAVATSKTARPATGSSTSRITSSTSRPATAASKPSTAATGKTAVSRVSAAPSAGRAAVTQSPKPATAAKKDVSRPPSATVPKKPTTAAATGSPAAKKQEPSKPMAGVRLNSAPKGSTATKATDAKSSQHKTQQPAKPTLTKKPASSVKMPPTAKLALGRTLPSSPVNKATSSSTSNIKRGPKPTQTMSPCSTTKKTEAKNATLSAAATLVVAGAVRADVAEMPSEADLQEPFPLASAPVEMPPQTTSQHPTTGIKPVDVSQSIEAVSSPLQSSVKTTSPQTPQVENGTHSSTEQQQIASLAKSMFPLVASPPNMPEETPYSIDKTTSTSATFPSAVTAIPEMHPPANLNEVDDEEEREGSQLVSVSEMSGTTQPTEESRPESCGQLGGSAWRAGGALLSELDSEEVSGSQQGASELSAPGVLEGTESMDDLGDGSLKGAIDMEGASAGSPDFEKVPDIPVNDFDSDDSDRVCDMDVGSERTDELRRPRHDNDDEEEEEEEEEEDDDDVEMASEGVTESGLESYGNADEDDFAEYERLDNLNRVVQPPPPPALPSAPAAQWDQPNPFMDPWAETLQLQQVLQPEAAAAIPVADPWQLDSETPAQAWLQLGSIPEKQDFPHHSSINAEPQNSESKQAPVQTSAPAPPSAPGLSQSSTLSSQASSPEDQGNYDDTKLQPQAALSPQADPGLGGEEEEEEEAEPETLPADEVLGGPSTAPTSNPSSSSVTEDEASDTEGEAQLEDSQESPVLGSITFVSQAAPQHCLSTVDEGEEAETVEAGAVEDATPPSATSLASYGFDSVTTASNSNALSAGESCIKSPGIFSLEELPEEAKDPPTEQQYIECGKQELESVEHSREEVLVLETGLDHSHPLHAEQQPEETPDDIQPPYYSICEKTEDSFAGFAAALHPHRRDHSAYPRAYYDIVKLPGAAAVVYPPKLTCADLPPRRSPGQQALSPQLRRLEQHQKQLQELQQRREQQSRPLEEAEQERKRRVEEEERRKKEEAEEEIKRNKEERKRKEEEELKQRRDLELQLQQQQQELKQRQQIIQWQQELQQANKAQTVLLSPSSGLCTIYEALENSEEEAEGDVNEQTSIKDKEPQQMCDSCEKVRSDEDKQEDSSLSVSPSPLPDSIQSSSSQDEDTSSPERPPPVDLDWGKKVDIVQQLINQTLMLNGDGCSSLLLLPGGAGGTLSPLESSLWPSLLPPLTPPSATVTSVSSFSPEASGSSPQGEWTVVELETHH